MTERALAHCVDFCAACGEYFTCDTMKPYRGDGLSFRDKMNAYSAMA